jgi:hypothetical protein
MTNGLTRGTVPALGGYVVSAARPGAEVPLTSHRLDPILASWRYGLGKVAVYTADLTGPWSARLRSSDVFEPFVTDLVRWVSRSANDEAFFVSIQRRQDHAALLVETVNMDGSYASLLDLRASVRRPSGETEQVRLPETTPGRYETEIPISEAGPYIVQIDGRSRDGAFSGQVLRGFYWSATAERRTRGVNTALLARMRDLTNGAVIDGRSNAPVTRSSVLRDMRPWLLSAAFLLFLIELLTLSIGAIFVRGGRPTSRIANESAA